MARGIVTGGNTQFTLLHPDFDALAYPIPRVQVEGCVRRPMRHATLSGRLGQRRVTSEALLLLDFRIYMLPGPSAAYARVILAFHRVDRGVLLQPTGTSGRGGSIGTFDADAHART